MKKNNLRTDRDYCVVRNDLGDEELVTQDDESDEVERTFNEMDFFGLPDKSTAHESFVGTGAIAFAPSVVPIEKARKSPKRRKKTESIMAQSRRLVEDNGSWFKEGPVRGPHEMDSLQGDGVANRTPTKETTGKRDAKMTNQGDLWPRKHRGNLAMGTPKSHGQTGDHSSEPGDAEDDGVTDAVGHDWPDGPKNSGQGVSEPFDRSLPGTEMPSGTEPKGFGTETPASDAKNEWSMSRISAMMESDSLSGVELQQLFDAYARETDYVCVENFSELCRAYGATNPLDEGVILSLMQANQEFVFHEGTDSNGSYWVPRDVVSEGIPASLKKHQFKKKGAKDQKDDTEDPVESRRGGRALTEAKFKPKKKTNKKKKKKPSFLKCESRDPNVRVKSWLSTAQEIKELLADGHVAGGNARRALQASFNCQLSMRHLQECAPPLLESVKMVVNKFGLSVDRKIQQAKQLWEAQYDLNDQYDDDTDGLDDQQFDSSKLDLPDVGQNPGVSMGDEFDDDVFDSPSDYDEDDTGNIGSDTEYDDGFDEFDGGEETGTGDGFDTDRFSGRPNDVSDDGISVDDYPNQDFEDDRGPGAGLGVPQSRPRRPGSTMGGWQEGKKQKRGSAPINEDDSWFSDGPTKTAGGHRMDQDGNRVGGKSGGGKGGTLPQDETDMEEVFDKNLLDADQENVGDGQVSFDRGGLGTMHDGHGPKGTAPEPKVGIKENVKRIEMRVKKRLQECLNGVRPGKYGLTFAAIVAGKNRKIHTAPLRTSLVEAATDAEELILLYGNARVMLEARLSSQAGKVRRERIALPALRRRGVFVSEGRAMFRFPKHAEMFAAQLLREGATCRVVPHNWGTAVESRINRSTANRAFAALIK